MPGGNPGGDADRNDPGVSIPIVDAVDATRQFLLVCFRTDGDDAYLPSHPF